MTSRTGHGRSRQLRDGSLRAERVNGRTRRVDDGNPGDGELCNAFDSGQLCAHTCPFVIAIESQMSHDTPPRPASPVDSEPVKALTVVDLSCSEILKLRAAIHRRGVAIFRSE